MLVPYLRDVDQSRWYSNFGRASQRLEALLAERYGLPSGGACVTCNGTAALMGALMALDVARDTLCLTPSFTFAATPAAPAALGLIPHFLDVDEATWALDPDHVREVIARSPTPVGVVIPVSPLGSPVDPEPWSRLQRDTGVPVLIDAAWAFDGTEISDVPTMISFHATKVFGVGEGGVVLCRDPAIPARLRLLSNFGFGGRRSAQVLGLNFKMSEHTASIGLAQWDAWPETRAQTLIRMGRYIERLAAIDGVSLMPGFDGGWAGALCCVRLLRGSGPDLVHRLDARNIEARQWWGEPCHTHPAFAPFPRGDMTATDRLASSVVGLPLWPDLPIDVVDEVCAEVAAAVR